MTKPSPNARAVVFWSVWFGTLCMVVVFQAAASRGVLSGPSSQSARTPIIVFVATIQVAVAVLIRWVLIPRLKVTGYIITVIKFLGSMLIGLMLCEAVEFYGLFLEPKSQHVARLFLLIIAILGMVQLAPTYARRIYGHAEPTPPRI